MKDKIYLLDTNSIIYALNARFKFPNHKYIVSVITVIELLSYKKLTSKDEKVLKMALSNFENINITDDVIERTIHIRKNSKIKLPDAIIMATALSKNAVLVTSDRQLLKSKLVDTVELNNLTKTLEN